MVINLISPNDNSTTRLSGILDKLKLGEFILNFGGYLLLNMSRGCFNKHSIIFTFTSLVHPLQESSDTATLMLDLEIIKRPP